MSLPPRLGQSADFDLIVAGAKLVFKAVSV